MLGYASPEELIAQVTDIGRQLHVVPERRREFMEFLEKQDQVKGFEAQMYRKDGSQVWVSGNARAVRDDAGQLLYYEGIVEDISQRKQAEQVLKTRAQQQEAVAFLSHRALQVTNLAVLMSEACALVSRILGLEHIAVWEPVADRLELIMRAGMGWPTGPRPNDCKGIGPSIPDGRALMAVGTLLLDDLQSATQAGISDLFHQFGLVSGRTVVLPGPNRPFALLGVFASQHRSFSMDETTFLQSVANVLAAAFERARAEVQRLEIEEEFYIARQIQLKLFPKVAPAFPGYDMAALSRSAVATGGDYYDYFPMPYGQLGIAVGDVSGHGFGPALLMASARAYLRGLAQLHSDVGQILALANRILHQDTQGDSFITLFLGRLDPLARTFIYSSAGHLMGYILNAQGQEKVYLKSTSVPLGIDAEGTFRTAPPVHLEPGDIILLLTDGIVEARSPTDEAFGPERTLEVVRANQGEPAGQIVEALYTAVTQFCAGRPPVDDITGMVIKVLP
jgi:PAS domain S-box-containing protein